MRCGGGLWEVVGNARSPMFTSTSREGVPCDAALAVAAGKKNRFYERVVSGVEMGI